MHDGGFSRQEYAWYESSIENITKNDNLSEKIKYELENHVQIILDKLALLGDNDDDVIKIISCHHLSSDQLQRLPTTKFTALACVFYLCHRLSIEIYKVAFSPKKIEGCVVSATKTAEFRQHSKILKTFEDEMKRILI